MKGSRTALKVISILILVFAVLMLIFSIVMFVGAAVINTSSLEGWAILAIVGAFILLVTGLIYLLIGILGIRGANNPKKIGPFFVFCIIGVILSLASLILSIVQNAFSATSLIGLIIVAVCLALAINIRKHARDLP